MSKVSIIVPYFKGAAYLEECIDSIEKQNLEDYEILELIGRKRGMLISGGEVNYERAAITVLDEYRSGKLGRITLEKPSDFTGGEN